MKAVRRTVAVLLLLLGVGVEWMPMRMNAGKRDMVGERQLSQARKMHGAGLLNDAGLRAAEAAVAKGGGK